MKVRAQTPVRSLLEIEAVKLTAVAAIGQLVILPRHADIAVRLQAGITTIDVAQHRTLYLAHGPGTLVKAGDLVRLSMMVGVVGDTLSQLKSHFRARQARATAYEVQSGAAANQLELSIIRKLIDLDKGTTHA